MSVLAVAEKDFRDAVRSRLMIGVAVLFVAFTGGGIALIVAFTPEEIGIGGAIEAVRQLIFGSSALFVPIVALGIGFKSIAGERQSGSLKLLLSLPNSRL
ncbi:ABC transporter, partial [Halobacteriales archaeon SW_5_68_122]